MTNTLYGLNPKTLASLKSVFAKYPEIKRVILYGSRAMGNYKEGSDIDLTLVAPNLNLQNLLAIQSEIEQLGLAYKVDLSLHHALENDSLKEHIDRVGIDF